MSTRRLTDTEYRQTLSDPVEDATQTASALVDIWPYVEAVPAADLEGHTLYNRFVEYVYRSADARFDHVLVMTRTSNVYLVVVVDRTHSTVYGHRLLDLNREYGLTPETVEGEARDT